MYCALVALILLAGIGIYNHCTRKPVIESVERDTVVVYDTIPHYYPTPKDSVRTKWVTRWLPARPDTIDHFIEVNNMDHYADTSKMIAVEVPITSKHYGCKDYDAWVSGYEPSLDSIKIYQRTEYITERITISKPPNKWELDLVGGLGPQHSPPSLTPNLQVARYSTCRTSVAGGRACTCFPKRQTLERSSHHRRWVKIRIF